jgi:hypothetical protein
MSDQRKTVTDIEREAAYSWREWPIYIVMRLKRLQAIQNRLRVGSETPSARIRRDELLKAVYDMDEIDEHSEPVPAGYIPPAEETGGGSEVSALLQMDAEEYADDIEYEDA